MDYHVVNRDGMLTVMFIEQNDKYKNRMPSNIEPNSTRKVDGEYTSVKYTGSNAIDFMMHVFSNKIPYNYERDMMPFSNFLPFKYTLVDDLGIPPHKTRMSDSGFDLNLIAVRKTIGNVTLYGTGVSVEPPTGFYFDMVPRSSMIKSGYMLANSVGIIDQGYTGEIMVPLVKIDQSAPDIELPCKMVQLIPRRWHGLYPVNSEQLNDSGRGEGGFGSTGK